MGREEEFVGTRQLRRTRGFGAPEPRWGGCPTIEAFSRAWTEESGMEADWAHPPADGRSSIRAWMAADWLLRRHAPAWLDAGGDRPLAGALRGLPEIASARTLQTAAALLQAGYETRDDWSARACDDHHPDAQSAAAVAAACELIRDAVLDAPWRAAWEATDCIAHEVRSVLKLARLVARDAAFLAGAQALEDVCYDVRTSALELVMRMLSE